MNEKLIKQEICKSTNREANFSAHFPSATPFFSILFMCENRENHQQMHVEVGHTFKSYSKSVLQNKIRSKRVQKTNSFFFVLNRMSPKARATAMSPQILPFTICRSHKKTLNDT